MALLGPQRQSFIERYKFYIEPASDDQLDFFRFFKWSAAPELFALRKQGGMPLFDWSYPLLAATLVQAFVASVLRSWPRLRYPVPGEAFPLGEWFLFSCHRPRFHVHGDRLHPEICAVSSHPLYAIAVVLCAFLVFLQPEAPGSPAGGSDMRPAPGI